MPTNHPINFEEKAKGAKGSTNADYPYAIKAQDLMRDFVYAALDADESLIETISGERGYPQRRLKIPALPSGSDPKSLQAQGGQLSWGEGGGVTREYYVTINGELFLEGFKCATQNESGQSYPIEV
jgi:hypothetical protein